MARADRSEPKPTLLTSLGVRATPDDEADVAPGPEETAADTGPRSVQEGTAPPAAAPRRARKKAQARPASTGGGPKARPAGGDGGPASPADGALLQIRQQHRVRRSEGVKPPLAPLNVDVPLDLLQHVRELSADIPYPLRRVVEEALELWLVATANTRPPG